MTVAVAAEDALVQPPGGAEYAIGTSLIVGEFDGRPVEKDPDEGIKYLKESFQKGFSEAPYALCSYKSANAISARDLIDAYILCRVASGVSGKSQTHAKEAFDHLKRTFEEKDFAMLDELKAAA